MKPTWIWYFGDFAIRQRLACDIRRLERNFVRPAPWHLDDCYHNVVFRKRAMLDAPETVTVLVDGVGSARLDCAYYPLNRPFVIEAGMHELVVEAANLGGLPAIFVQGERFASDESWEVSHDNLTFEPAEGWERLCDPQSPPSAFAFPATEIELTPMEIGGKTVLDAGKETFARLSIACKGQGRVRMYLGESLPEVCSDDPYIWFEADAAPEITHTALAMRYLRTETEGDCDCAVTAVRAFYEDPGLAERGSFTCSDERMNRIMEISRHTLALNCREVIFDGIKRDRYCWSGDAYQSYLLNYYLYFDRDLCRRTIQSLGGKDGMTRHINTIMDYSFYWILSVGDYLRYTGDAAFVRRILPRVKRVMDFCVSRTDEEGLAVPRWGDWIFVDWSEYLDKEGPIAIEQMLLCRALELVADLSARFGEDGERYAEHARRLEAIIEARYFDRSLGAYIDSYVSGRRNISRQTNLFAIRYGFATGDRARAITELLKSEDIGPISTPYFKFYELEALGMAGEMEEMTSRIRSYWGGMLDLGATSFWEKYEPEKPYEEQLHMYGTPFDKSLCHAWGASPIYLYGRFYLGVHPDADGYASYTVAPQLGGLSFISGTVPVPGGVIEVWADEHGVRVKSPIPGGRLIWRGVETEIPAGEEICIRVE